MIIASVGCLLRALELSSDPLSVLVLVGLLHFKGTLYLQHFLELFLKS